MSPLTFAEVTAGLTLADREATWQSPCSHTPIPAKYRIKSGCYCITRRRLISTGQQVYERIPCPEREDNAHPQCVNIDFCLWHAEQPSQLDDWLYDEARAVQAKNEADEAAAEARRVYLRTNAPPYTRRAIKVLEGHLIDDALRRDVESGIVAYNDEIAEQQRRLRNDSWKHDRLYDAYMPEDAPGLRQALDDIYEHGNFDDAFKSTFIHTINRHKYEADDEERRDAAWNAIRKAVKEDHEHTPFDVCQTEFILMLARHALEDGGVRKLAWPEQSEYDDTDPKYIDEAKRTTERWFESMSTSEC